MMGRIMFILTRFDVEEGQTSPKHDEFRHVENGWGWAIKKDENKNYIEVQCGDDKLIIIHGAKCYNKKLKKPKNCIKELLSKVLKQYNASENLENILILVHLIDINQARELVENNFKSRVATYSTTIGEAKTKIQGLMEAYRNYKNCRDFKNLSNHFNEVWNFFRKRLMDFLLTLLLHRIAHLFLPIDIDLMGICEVLRDDFEPPQSKTKEKWAEEYYNEAFNDTSPQKRFKELCEQAKNEIESMKLDDDKKQKILQMLCDNKNLGLPDKPDIAKFKDWAKNPEENPFHQWFREVMEVMEELKRI